MFYILLLLPPAGLAVAAILTGNLVLKLSVPLSCAAIVERAARGTSARYRTARWIVAAFCLSAAGDYFLSTRNGRVGFFVTGIAFYFGAHMGYLAFAQCHGRPQKWVLGVLLALYLPYYIFWLAPVIADAVLSGAVLLYLLISCLVLAAACGMQLSRWLKWPYVLGMGLIVVSDTIISFTEFLGYQELNWLIMPTYFLAHLCVSWSVLRQLHRAEFR